MSEAGTIVLPSRFDYSYHKQFSEIYLPLVEDTAIKNIILDFSRVDYLDSSALGMMVMVQKKASLTGKKVKIKGAKGATEEILSMANMQKLFDFI